MVTRACLCCFLSPLVQKYLRLFALALQVTYMIQAERVSVANEQQLQVLINNFVAAFTAFTKSVVVELHCAKGEYKSLTSVDWLKLHYSR